MGHLHAKVGLATAKTNAKPRFLLQFGLHIPGSPDAVSGLKFAFSDKSSCIRDLATSWDYLLPSVGVCSRRVEPVSCPGAMFLHVGS